MLPKNWNDITLEQYVAVYKTLDEQPTTPEAQLDLLIKRTCLLTNKEPDWVEDNCTMKDLAKMQDFLKADLPLKLITDFRFNGKRYKISTNPMDYDPDTYKSVVKNGDNMEKIDAHKLDFDRYMSVMNQLKDRKLQNLHKVIFQICREVDWRGRTIPFDLGKIGETIESFKQLPLKIANPISVFFCSLSENLTQSTLEYLTNKMKTQTKELQTEIDSLSYSAG